MIESLFVVFQESAVFPSALPLHASPPSIIGLAGRRRCAPLETFASTRLVAADLSRARGACSVAAAGFRASCSARSARRCVRCSRLSSSAELNVGRCTAADNDPCASRVDLTRARPLGSCRRASAEAAWARLPLELTLLSDEDVEIFFPTNRLLEATEARVGVWRLSETAIAVNRDPKRMIAVGRDELFWRVLAAA
ncbi:hypothetical protein MRX96_016865 [Rhipicephalus microplus]